MRGMKIRLPITALCIGLLALPAQAVHPQREQARARVAQQQYASALELLRPLVAQFPQDSDLLIETARIEGFADRNAQAADLYEQVLRVAPQRRTDVLSSLAWQSLWAGRHDRAIELFRERMNEWATPEQTADSRRGLIEALRARLAAQTAQGDSTAALDTLDQLDAVRTRDADAWAERARLLGRLDRNGESAAAWARAIELAPARRREWLSALAWQTLWNSDAHTARGLFAEAHAAGVDLPETWRGLAQSCAALDRHPCAADAWDRLLQARPDDRQALGGRARALLWSDRHDEAEAAYRRLLADRPDDAEARQGLAQVLNFSGRHRAAVSEFRRIEPSGKDDEGRRVAQARALYWAGYADQAMPLLDPLQDADARWLRDARIRRDTTPRYASAGLDYSEDADRLNILTPWALTGWRLSPTETAEIGLRLPRLSGRPVNGGARASITGQELSARYSGRIGAVDSPRGTLWPSLTVGVRDYDGWTSLLWRARARHVPADLWRIDAEIGNGVIDTISALNNRVDYRDASLGVEYRPTPRWSFAGGLARLDFDDGNQRNRLTWRTDYGFNLVPRLLVGLEGQTFDNSRPWDAQRLNRGYYNPDRYSEARIFLALYREYRPWAWYLKGATGRYSERDGFGGSASGRNYLVEGWISYDLGPGWELRAAAGMSDSEAGSASGGSGYWRRFGSLSINAWW